MNTLLVIDMQNAWLNGDTPRLDKDGVIARINHAALSMRERGGQVIFILHNNEEAAIGSPGWQLDAGLVVVPGDVMVEKTACDSFVDTKLLEQLAAFGTRYSSAVRQPNFVSIRPCAQACHKASMWSPWPTPTPPATART